MLAILWQIANSAKFVPRQYFRLYGTQRWFKSNYLCIFPSIAAKDGAEDCTSLAVHNIGQTGTHTRNVSSLL